MSVCFLAHCKFNLFPRHNETKSAHFHILEPCVQLRSPLGASNKRNAQPILCPHTSSRKCHRTCMHRREEGSKRQSANRRLPPEQGHYPPSTNHQLLIGEPSIKLPQKCLQPTAGPRAVSIRRRIGIKRCQNREIDDRETSLGRGAIAPQRTPNRSSTEGESHCLCKVTALHSPYD